MSNLIKNDKIANETYNGSERTPEPTVTALDTTLVKDTDYTSGKLIPSIFNQALMELGATVCVPNGAPYCEDCPWHDFCEARLQNRIAELPVKKKNKERRIEKKTVLIVKDGELLALHKRMNKGLLAGLYELPNLEGHLSEEEVLEVIKQKGFEAVRIQSLCDAKHIFSHVEWHMKGYAVFISNREYQPMKEIADWVFVEVSDTKDNYAIPSAFSKYTEFLQLVLGKEAAIKQRETDLDE